MILKMKMTLASLSIDNVPNKLSRSALTSGIGEVNNINKILLLRMMSMQRDSETCDTWVEITSTTNREASSPLV